MRNDEVFNKIHTHILSKININDLTSYKISFPLEELVTSGICADWKEASKEFRSVMRVLMGIKIETESHDYMEIIRIYIGSGADEENCYFILNDEIDWKGPVIDDYIELFFPERRN